jgi:acetyltransferase
MARFHEELSDETVSARYFTYMKLSQRTAHERLTRICFIDYDREMALVATAPDPDGGESRIVAVGRLSKAHGRNEAEFAILVSDAWQKHGLGGELLRRLVDVGRDERLDRIFAEMLASNTGMRRTSEAAGFHVRSHPDDPSVALAELDLRVASDT